MYLFPGMLFSHLTYFDAEVLEVGRARVRCAADDDRRLVRTLDPRLDGIEAEIRVDRCCVEAQIVEKSLHVGARRVLDIAALRIGERDDVRWNGGQRLSERCVAALRAERLVERDVRLVRADEVARRFDDRDVERGDVIGAIAIGHQRRVRVQPDAQQAPALLPRRLKLVSKSRRAGALICCGSRDFGRALLVDRFAASSASRLQSGAPRRERCFVATAKVQHAAALRARVS